MLYATARRLLLSSTVVVAVCFGFVNPARACVSDSDCKHGRICVANACTTPACSSDKDCPGESICDAGRCHPAQQAAAPAPTAGPAPATPPASAPAAGASDRIDSRSVNLNAHGVEAKTGRTCGTTDKDCHEDTQVNVQRGVVSAGYKREEDCSASGGAGCRSVTEANASTSGLGFSVTRTGGKDMGAEKRADWMKRGGALLSYSANAQLTGFYQPASGGAKCCVGGVGGGSGARVGLLLASMPDPERGTSTWMAFRAGAGFDVTYFALSPPGTNDFKDNATSFGVPAHIGAQIGLGSFRGASDWRGVVLGLDWQPSYTYVSVKSSGGTSSGSGNFNYLGVDVTIDVASLAAAMDRLAAEPHFRVTLLLLPPIGDMPLMGTLGIGAVWY